MSIYSNVNVKTMIKIAILIEKIDLLQNWEFKIIEIIRNSSNLELDLLLIDGRVKEVNANSKGSIRRFGNLFSEFLFKKQVSIEEKRYLKNQRKTDRTELISYLNDIPNIELIPKQNGNLDISDTNVLRQIKTFGLDVIFSNKFIPIKGEILNTAKYGIWLLNHADNLKLNYPIGFMEVLLKKPVVAVTLFKLTPQKGKGILIDKAYFNRHSTSFVITNNLIKELSISLLLKNIKNLETVEKLLTDKTINFNYSNDLPSLLNMSKYLIEFYSNILKNRFRKVRTSSDRREKCWSLYLGKGNFMEADLTILKSVKLPEGVFWADPFLFNYKGQYFVFFESYSYKTKIGGISCGLIINDEIKNVVAVLDCDYHVSYPFIFEEDGEIFLMPETHENKRLEVYRCVNFPNRWVLHATAFEGEALVDATLFIDKQEQKWLFINKMSVPETVFDNELYIYKVDSLKLNKLEPHKNNPVIIDSRIARNGGAIFEYKGKLFRPSQSNTHGIYGRGLNINHIKKLTIDEYEEEIERKIEPNFQNGLIAIHHLHQIEGRFIFDAAKDL